MRAFGVLAELFGPGMPGARWNDYLSVGNVKVGVRFTDVAQQTVTTRYYHTDHLGSVSVITDEAGAIVERLAFDAWGKRRFANGADDPAGSIESLTTRGFTGHEQLDQVGLVHMNGRVYDPLVGRMISADPTIPDALNGQAWNRYSYVGNDPLTFTDPNGYSWLSRAFRSIGNFFKRVLQNPIVRAIVTIALNIALPVIGTALGIAATIATPFIAAAASSAIVTGLSGGNLGQILRAGALAGATAFAFSVVGGATNAVAGHDFSLTNHVTPQFGSEAHIFNIAGHAGVGCLTSAASGGDCGSGALSGAAGAAAGPLVNITFRNPDTNIGDLIGGTAVSGLVGGLASVAGGGKFENGAVTAAFGYLFNQAAVGLKKSQTFGSLDELRSALLKKGTNAYTFGARPLGGIASFFTSNGGHFDRQNIQGIHEHFFWLDESGAVKNSGYFKTGVGPDPSFPGNIQQYRFEPIQRGGPITNMVINPKGFGPNDYGWIKNNCQDYCGAVRNSLK